MSCWEVLLYKIYTYLFINDLILVAIKHILVLALCVGRCCHLCAIWRASYTLYKSWHLLLSLLAIEAMKGEGHRLWKILRSLISLLSCSTSSLSHPIKHRPRARKLVLNLSPRSCRWKLLLSSLRHQGITEWIGSYRRFGWFVALSKVVLRSLI